MHDVAYNANPSVKPTEILRAKMIRICFGNEAYSFVEFFAGTASCSRAIRSAGHDVAALDIVYWSSKPGKQNAMDILTPSGMGPLVQVLYNICMAYMIWCVL